MSIYKNRAPNIEFLDNQLRICGKNHILQKTLFIILSSIEMIATSRLFPITDDAVFMPVRWLASNTHKLAHHNWGACSIDHVFDILHTALNNILDDITLIHDISTMMFIFKDMLEEIPEFKAFLVYDFQNKRTEFVIKSQTKELALKKLVEVLFSPQDRNNKYSTTILETPRTLYVKDMIKELKDKTKATYKYLPIYETEYS